MLSNILFSVSLIVVMLYSLPSSVPAKSFFVGYLWDDLEPFVMRLPDFRTGSAAKVGMEPAKKKKRGRARLRKTDRLREARLPKMKIELHCHICATEGHELHLASRVSVNDPGVYQATCPVGHKWRATNNYQRVTKRH